MSSREEVWEIKDPLCTATNCYRVVIPAGVDPAGRWPILQCKCGRYFSKRDAEFFRDGLCKRAEDPSESRLRQTDRMYILGREEPQNERPHS